MSISRSDPTKWVLTPRDCLFEGVRVCAAVGRNHSTVAPGEGERMPGVSTGDSDKGRQSTGWRLGGIADPFTRLVYTFGDLDKRAWARRWGLQRLGVKGSWVRIPPSRLEKAL